MYDFLKFSALPFHAAGCGESWRLMKSRALSWNYYAFFRAALNNTVVYTNIVIVMTTFVK